MFAVAQAIEKEVLLHSRSNQRHPQRPSQPTVTIKQVEIDRAENGNRRLFRSEVNGTVTGFVEKHFSGGTFVKEFAIGGRINGVDEAIAKVRFRGLPEKPAVPVKKAEVSHGLPDFITEPQPMMKGKSAAPKPDRSAVPKPVVVKKPAAKRPAEKPMTRKEGLALAGSLLKSR